MKPLLGVMLFITLIGPAMAGPMLSKGKVRLADAASDACFASCASSKQFLQTDVPDHI